MIPIAYTIWFDVRRPPQRLPRRLGVVPVRVAHDQSRLVLRPLADVVRAGRDHRRADALGTIGRLVGIAEKNGIVSRAMKSGASFFSRITSVVEFGAR